jgi:hypothetical protein
VTPDTQSLMRFFLHDKRNQGADRHEMPTGGEKDSDDGG